MRKRGTLGKGLVVIAFWVLGAAILILTLAQVRDYAGIINDSGVVRGGTQRVVKMELVGQSATSTEQRVTSLLEKLTANERSACTRASKPPSSWKTSPPLTPSGGSSRTR